MQSSENCCDCSQSAEELHIGVVIHSPLHLQLPKKIARFTVHFLLIVLMLGYRTVLHCYTKR